MLLHADLIRGQAQLWDSGDKVYRNVIHLEVLSIKFILFYGLSLCCSSPRSNQRCECSAPKLSARRTLGTFPEHIIAETSVISRVTSS